MSSCSDNVRDITLDVDEIPMSRGFFKGWLNKIARQ